MPDNPPQQIRSFSVGSPIGEVLVHDGDDATLLAEVSPLMQQLGTMVGNALGLEQPESILLLGKSVSTLSLEMNGNCYTALFEGTQSREVKAFLTGLTELTDAMKGGSNE